MKWVPQVLPPWVDSNLWVRQGPTSRSNHPLIGQTEKNVSISHGSSYRFYLYFPYPNYPGASPLVPSCRFLHSSLQIWFLLWHQSGISIIPKWSFHLMSTIRFPSCLPSHLICCLPGVLGVCRVHTYREGSLSEIEDLFTHFIMNFNDESSVAAAKSIYLHNGLSCSHGGLVIESHNVVHDKILYLAQRSFPYNCVRGKLLIH